MKKNLFLVLLVAYVGVLHGHPALEWWQWNTEHSRQYQSRSEEAARRDTWMTNYEYVQNYNAKSGATRLELNQFADLVSQAPFLCTARDM